jgi:uncharacterized protein YggE
MKKIMLMVAVLISATLSAVAQTAQPYTYENTVEVTGRAEKEIVPDEIYIRIVIDETALKQKQTVEKMETDMIAALKKLGIDTDKDLKIGNMSSEYKDYFLKNNTARTTATYELKVNGVQLLGRVYQTLEGLGISNLNITKLSHSKIKEFQEELRVEALQNAQQVAKRLAEAIGQKAGRAVQIVDYNNDIYVAAPRADVMMIRGAGAAPQYDTELEFKDIKLTYNIQAKFALE